MLGQDENIYRDVVAGAVRTAGDIAAVTQAVQDQGYDNVFLVGSGGSYGVMLAYESLWQQHSAAPVRAAVAAELILMGSPALGTRSVAIFSSLSGTTRETVAAAEYCRDHGVITIGLTGEPGTPLGAAVDHELINAADNNTAAESINIQLVLLVTGLLARRGEFDAWDDLVRESAALPEALLDVNRRTDDRAAAFAAAHRDTGYHFVIGAGNLWGQAYNYSMCVLEEMQWLHTTRVHGAEFFHGSLELVEKNTSMLLLFGEDDSRPLMDRVRRFADEYSDAVTVFDTRDYPLDGISERFRGILSPTVMGAACTRISKHLEVARDHSLDLRRYYRVVEY